MPISLARARCLADSLLLVLMVAAAFLLGCQELFDTDVWWHLRAGQWIWAERRVPDLDPFTFASANRPWVDLHWVFQLMLAGAYAAGGVRGMVLLAACLGVGVLWAGLSARERAWPVWVVVICWMPALLAMSSRFDPRPELVSLMGMAAYLLILPRTDRRPLLAWLLPAVQVIWVNAHALFVLGPIILGTYLLDHAVGLTVRSSTEPQRSDHVGRRWWLHMGGATAAIVLACLVNPYGLRGALFPLELFPKITSWGGLYKSYILEFRGLKAFVAVEGPQRAAADLYFCVEVLLLATWPLSFLVPALGRATGPGSGRRLGRVAVFAMVGFGAEAAWLCWLNRHLFGPETGLALDLTTALLGSAAALLTVRSGSRAVLFRLVLAVVFSYLAIQAVRNVNLFGLVAGFVLAWNLGEWAGAVGESIRGRWPGACSVMGMGVRLALLLVVGLGIITIGSGAFFRVTGEQRRLGLSEQPLAYAHEAARFAGRPGLPPRALALDLRQAGVYLFHNAPEHQLFMDARLEIPSRSTFETFVRVGRLLNDGQPGWAELLRRMGEPLVLLDHGEDAGAEATLLAEPGWRCLYFDEVASVFVSRRPEIDGSFPAVDFAARHFDDLAWRAIPPVPRGLAEAMALVKLTAAVRQRPGLATNWPFRLTLMLLAADRFQQAITAVASVPSSAAVASEYWTLLGNCRWNMIADLSAPPAGPDELWDPASGVLWAQATFGYRRALELNPDNVAAMLSLHDAFKARRMFDAQQQVVERLRQVRNSTDRTKPTLPPAPADAPAEPLPAWLDPGGLSRAVGDLLGRGRAEAAVRLMAEADRRSIVASWADRDRLATTLLHLGRPAAARAVWEGAADPPSPAARLARLALAALAAHDAPTAERQFRAAIGLDPRMGDAWFGLALLCTEKGDALGALTAARTAMQCPLTPSQTTFMAGIEALARPYARSSSLNQPRK
jgi:tetratricopeptide (TPR) repeat protein